MLQLLCMYIQSQSTALTLLQLQIQSLHQWVHGLLENGKGKDLTKLFATLPSIKKLAGLDIGFSFTFTIDNVGHIEVSQLKELAQTMASHIKEFEKGKEYIENSNSSQRRNLIMAFKNGFIKDLKTYDGTLDKSPTDWDILYNMMEALKVFMQASNQKFSHYLEKVISTEIWHHSFDFLISFQRRVVDTFFDYVRFAAQQTYNSFDREVRKGRIILTQESERIASYRHSMPIKQERNKFAGIVFKKKDEKLKADILEQSVDKSAKRTGFVKLPYFPSPHQPKKKHGKSKPRD